MRTMSPCALLSLLLLAAVEAEQHVSHAFLGVHQQPPPPEGGYKEITANDHNCYMIWLVIMVGSGINLVGWVTDSQVQQNGGTCITLTAATVGTFYVLHHGLLEAWMAGTIDPIKHQYCAAIAPVAIIMWIFFACICCCCGIGIALTAAEVVNKMAEQRKIREAALQQHAPESIKHIHEPSFREKCEKAFKEADADGNGKLDLSELRHVVAFDLTDEEKEMVQSMELWDKAFVTKDANKDNAIDVEEFVEVMKWVQVTVKHAEAVKNGTIPKEEKTA